MTKTADSVEILLSSMQNPTKMSVILLLADNRKMTVTQMSKFIKVSRANLYHFVSELVKDSLLSKPESVVKGNYVEKYYSINEQTWKKISGEGQEKRISAFSPEEMRSLLRSFFLSMSLYFRFYAERTERASKADLEKVLEEVKNHNIMLSYSKMGDDEYRFVMTELKKIRKNFDEIAKHERESDITKHGNRLIIASIPSSVFSNMILP